MCKGTGFGVGAALKNASAQWGYVILQWFRLGACVDGTAAELYFCRRHIEVRARGPRLCNSDEIAPGRGLRDIRPSNPLPSGSKAKLLPPTRATARLSLPNQRVNVDPDMGSSGVFGVLLRAQHVEQPVPGCNRIGADRPVIVNSALSALGQHGA
ncbi:hypothetical protein EVAR_77230_1 [Eumeta japonica]|uniref:Uncharacterized protein n=1 Tax=Eumeta variegata TaxID=151549 RepID=A0A4C1T2Z9_EUMVA|nr:hypothetical protein EVAR_77230_1 [Eumeta japonica]